MPASSSGSHRAGSDVEVVTAAASERDQRRIAGSLAARGLRQGDRVAVVLPGSGSSLALILGALRTGVVPVPLDPNLTSHERTALITDVDPALVVDSPALLAELLAGPDTDLAPWPLTRPMHFTSGTTGRPKGVWSGILSADEAAALAREEQELWQFDAADRHMVLSPLHHSAPIRFASGTLLAGGTVIIGGPFDPARFVAIARDRRPTTAFGVPAHLQRLFAYLDDTNHPRDTTPLGGTKHLGGDLKTALLGSFRLFAHAGAPCPPPLKQRAIDAFPDGSIWEFYGSTEGQFTACTAAQWLERPGTVGRARPHRRLSVDEDGRIWCAAPDYARFEYWKDPAKTAAAWRETGTQRAFSVGDLGRLDDAGFLFLSGRREDLIISGGVNVYPAEVEAVLSACAGVDDIAVFGVDDERWGQRVCAAVVGAADDETLSAYARERLAPAKRPKQFHRLDDLPRTATGKVRRLDLPSALGL